MPERYQFRPSYQSRKVTPTVVATELQALHDSGGLTASRLVESATPVDAPLHGLFEWDNAVAGHEFRLMQGRQLIRAVVLVSEAQGDYQVTAQSLFVHVPAEPGQQEASREGKYVPLQVVAADAAEYERALVEAERRLDAADRAFGELRRVTEGKGGHAEALAIAVQGFATVKAAIALLRG